MKKKKDWNIKWKLWLYSFLRILIRNNTCMVSLWIIPVWKVCFVANKRESFVFTYTHPNPKLKFHKKIVCK